MHRADQSVLAVEALSSVDLRLDAKADFAEKSNLEALQKLLKTAQIPSELKPDEEHSSWMLTFHDATQGERRIDIELAAQPEYRKLRAVHGGRFTGRADHHLRN